MLRACVLASLASVAPQALIADDQTYWDQAGPTAAEVEHLCLLNRFRADPLAEADRIIAERGGSAGIDWATFRAETNRLRPVAPAVWSAELTVSSRLHIRHLLATNGRGHGETEGGAYFVSGSHTKRMQAAGYAGRPTSENWAGFAAPLMAHQAWIVDAKGRDVGHRRAMIAGGNREVGIAMHGHGLQNFGTPRGNGVLVNVVVYVDRNGDERYNAGEGVRDVVVSSNGTEGTTDATGYLRLVLPAGSAGSISATRGRMHLATVVEAENGTMHWEVRAENPHARDIERALGKAARYQDRPDRLRSAAVALALMADQAFLDQDLAQRVWAIAGEARAEIRAVRDAVVDGNATPAQLIERCAGWHAQFDGTAYAPVIEMIEGMARAQAAGDSAGRERQRALNAVAERCPDWRIALRARAEAALLSQR